MANRDPISFTIYTSREYGNTAEWTEVGSYELKEIAIRALEALVVQGYRVKYVVTYPNGIETARVIEGAVRIFPPFVDNSADAPTPPPPPPPAPAPPMLDFQEASNFINFVTFLR